MQRTWVKYTRSLFTEGFLDSQFAQLQLLQDERNPDLVVEVVSLFFEDSDRLLDDLTKALDPQQGVDFKKVDAHVHQLKSSSSSIGVQRGKNACVAFRSFCDEQNIEGSLRCLQQVKQEYYLVKNKLENLIRLEQQIVAAGGSIPIHEGQSTVSDPLIF
ncbi:Histidine-containing phosphotransfer protein 1 [Linum perenne]